MVDIGTGAGEHLFSLHRHFPDKTYTGIDRSSQLIQLAQDRLAESDGADSQTMTFITGDAYSYSSEKVFDVAVARLLIQHLSDLDRFLENTARLLAPGGALIVIESDDAARRFIPELPLITSLFKELETKQKRIDGRRDAGRIFKGLATSSGFSLVLDQQITIPSSLPTYKDMFSTILF